MTKFQAKNPCQHCNAIIFFDSNKKTSTGKFIPLNDDGSSHDCQGKYQKKETDKEQTRLSTASETNSERMALRKEAINNLKALDGDVFDKASEEKKIEMITKEENLLVSMGRFRK